MKIKCHIFMPTPTPNIKIKAVRSFGKEFSNVYLVGDTYDESLSAAKDFCEKNNCIFVHAFDDEKVIEG